MKYLLLRLFVYLLPTGIMRTKFLVKYKVFKEIGKNFYFCPRKIPADPKLIKFHDNVAVATDVTFINHDVCQKVFNAVNEEKLPKYFGCIEIGNNVFIGAKAIILPNVRVCDNVYIAAGAIVTKSIDSPGIYGGTPARKIGDMEQLHKARLAYAEMVKGCKSSKELEALLWEQFYKENQ